MQLPRYCAQSASDRTNDWPYWFVADRQKGGLNITFEALAKIGVVANRACLPFLDRADAEYVANRLLQIL